MEKEREGEKERDSFDLISKYDVEDFLCLEIISQKKRELYL